MFLFIMDRTILISRERNMGSQLLTYFSTGLCLKSYGARIASIWKAFCFLPLKKISVKRQETFRDRSFFKFQLVK